MAKISATQYQKYINELEQYRLVEKVKIKNSLGNEYIFIMLTKKGKEYLDVLEMAIKALK